MFTIIIVPIALYVIIKICDLHFRSTKWKSISKYVKPLALLFAVIMMWSTYASYDSMECFNAYNLQYQLDEIADTKHNAQMMLLMPELTGMQRASLKVTVRKADKEMRRLEPMFQNWFSLCK